MGTTESTVLLTTTIGTSRKGRGTTVYRCGGAAVVKRVFLMIKFYYLLWFIFIDVSLYIPYTYSILYTIDIYNYKL